MKATAQYLPISMLLLAGWFGRAAPALAQAAPPSDYTQVVSANPIGLLVELFNAEYERRASLYSTAGIGGSFLALDGNDYLNADVFLRYYPQGQPLERFAFGIKAGLTNVDGGSYFGAGFDANYSWLLGAKNNFYVGTGFGLKRIIGTSDEDDLLSYVPTFRVINIGFAF